MSVVARYLLQSRSAVRAGFFDRCQNVADHWASAVRRGRPAVTADWRLLPMTTAGSRLAVLRAVGPKSETAVGLAETDGRVVVFVELRAIDPAVRRATLPDTPACVRHLLDMTDAGWEVGGDPYTPVPPVYTPRTVSKLQGRVLSSSRPPLVVVSEDGFRPELAGRLAVELGGLAAVAAVDEPASVKLTHALTQAWGCFNGAVRVYWPGEAGNYWKRGISTPEVVAAVRDEVMRWSATRVLPPAVFAPPKPPPAAVGRPPPAANPAASGWLKAKAARSKAAAGPATAKAAVAGPSTPAGAVKMAKKRYAGRLVFGADVTRGTNRLAASAGPPAKILEWLGLLAELVDVRRANDLTGSPAEWLRRHGAKSSGESKRVRTSEKARNHRKWDCGDRTRRYFDDHFKPSRGFLGECARVYYQWCDERKVYVVGWVGPHPPE